MKRKAFIKTCCYSAIGIPLFSSIQSCAGIYYANATREKNRLIVKKSEFSIIKNDKITDRDFVLIKIEQMGFPICLYKTKEEKYSASLMTCTHKGCELNVGGGIYSCPCHGSEFSKEGKVLQGPADRDLTTYKTSTDNENIYILIS